MALRENPFRRGDEIVLPAGTKIVYTTHPSNPKHLSRKQTVRVVDADPAYGETDLPRIWWAGQGGYWRVVEATPEVIRANPGVARV